MPNERSDFVVRDVLPHLSQAPEVSMSRAEIREAVPRWLAALGQACVVAYELRVDWRLLGALFEDEPNRIGLHGTILRWSDSAMEERFATRSEAWFIENGFRHNALGDARCFRASVLAIEEEFGHRVA